MPRPSPLLPARAQKNRLRPFSGEKVHWTFSCFRLTSRRRGVLSPFSRREKGRDEGEGGTFSF